LLPYDRPKLTPPPGKGATYVLKVEKELAEKLRRLAQQKNATIYMVLLAAYQTLLYRYTGQQDIAVGSNVARRTRAELERQIGYFANNVIIRTKLSVDWSFYEMLASVRDAALSAYTHQNIPLDRVAQELAAERDPKRPLIFHVTFTLQNLPRSEFRLGNMELLPFEMQISPAKHDISVFVTDTGGPILFGALYNMDLFNADTIATFFEHYSFLLESVVNDPALPLSKLALCSNWKEGSGTPAGCHVHCHTAD
ncbi:MAG TPA: condensation domain-containing protein, partial [Candidatus Angelobacter sp.]|nr:condensation domain-containing protein [Candidatus Angelobacter sp.]